MNGSLISTSGFLGRRGGRGPEPGTHVFRTRKRCWVGVRVVGKPKSGAVKMTITSRIRRNQGGPRLHEAIQVGEQDHFQVRFGEGGTTVVWQVLTPKSLATRIFGIFMNFDKMVGGDLERGLAKLKTVAE